MKLKNIAKFFQSMYVDKAGQDLNFEVRNTQIVSKLMTEDETAGVYKKLVEILPICANITAVKSRGKSGKFRIVLHNPLEIFQVYAEIIAKSLNKNNPFPLRELEKNDLYRWKASLWRSPLHTYVTISYWTAFSTFFPPLFMTPDRIGQAEVAKYNSDLQLKYQGLEIGFKSHKREDHYSIDDFKFSDYLLLHRDSSLLELCYKFFEEHPEVRTEENLSKLPTILKTEIAAMNVSVNTTPQHN